MKMWKKLSLPVSFYEQNILAALSIIENGVFLKIYLFYTAKISTTAKREKCLRSGLHNTNGQ